jgi:serine/threonine protein phosphatase PrpC
MSITGRIELMDGDLLLACTDGFWSGLEDRDMVRLGTGQRPLDQLLNQLSELAVNTNSPHSDNTSALAMIWRSQ